jgi:hypothetical protein
MRRAITVILAISVPFAVTAQVAPSGWSTILGKTCAVRDTSEGGGEAKFVQDASGPSVQFRAAGRTEISKVIFNPPNGIAFESFSTADGYKFTYDDKAKRWSGTFAGLPSYLICPP